ncbi:MAG: HEAT repeat domain-containing protein [Nitrospirae bacterium]|nr:HEAT repeat domain-containing protein [Nitrospirota bacterium]
MQNNEGQEEIITPEVQDVMRSLVSAIRAVKLYPANNPIYSQSIKKSFEVLDHFLNTAPEYRVGVHQTQFTYHTIAIGKEAQLNKTIAQDIFAKGVREIVFKNGVTEEQLIALYRALALSPEELAMKSGISSILWEDGATHIQITESGLDEVILTRKESRSPEERKQTESPSRALNPATAKKEIVFAGRTLILDDLMNDPVGFGSSMLSLAMQTRDERESVEDRLYTLYLEGGRKIRDEDPDQSDILFEGLAKSVLSLEPPYREKIIAGKLYRELDEESLSEQKDALEEQVPNELHEILTGRFSNAWTMPQVKELLKQSSTKKTVPTPTLSFPPTPASLEGVPISPDLADIARDMAEYTPEEMEALKNMSTAGMESDIIEAAVRTLLFLLLQMKDHHRPATAGKEIELLSSVVHQLEDMMSYLLKKKDYTTALMIGSAFLTPVDPVFKPRMMEAIRKAASRSNIMETIADLRRYPKGSPEYVAAYSYLSIMERESTEVLLELLAEEKDRSTRKAYLDFAKDLGKNQIMLIGEHLADERWYYVRNIVSILGESKADQAIAFLSKVAGHANFRIRQEVVKGLLSIGGKKAASLLATFLNDKEADIQLMSIRGIAVVKGAGLEAANALMDFLANRPLKKSNQELTLEAIKTLGKIGGADAGEFLNRYRRVKWWRSRTLQLELRSAALQSMKEIERRQGDGGRATR